eukprot:TRINITY_DN1540_c0_g6_i1.p1 TRINITY_DN1540_c0_g6~~TRINITY_DN1540_c0_g6_i1.p1  ORF type:complete len:1143 (+),score=260.82 TRINITY_DN1540_c0_g6_i1:212-3640(+)
MPGEVYHIVSDGEPSSPAPPVDAADARGSGVASRPSTAEAASAWEESDTLPFPNLVEPCPQAAEEQGSQTSRDGGPPRWTERNSAGGDAELASLPFARSSVGTVPAERAGGGDDAEDDPGSPQDGAKPGPSTRQMLLAAVTKARKNKEEEDRHMTERQKVATQRIHKMLYNLPAFAPDYGPRRLWDVAIMWLIQYHMVVCTVTLVLRLSPGPWTLGVELGVSLLLIVDMFINCNTAVQKRSRDFTLLTNRMDILKHYAGSGDMLIDLLGGLPIDVMLWFVLEHLQLWLIFRGVRLVKIFKLRRLLVMTERGTMDAAYVKFYFWISPLLWLGWKMFFSAHVLTLCRIIVAPDRNPGECDKYGLDACTDNPMEKYFYAFFWVWALLTGQGLAETESLRVYAYGAFVLGVGLVMQGHIVATMSAMMLKSNVEENNRDSMRSTLALLVHYNIPRALQQEVLSFQFHSLQQNAAAGSLGYTLSGLPDGMKREVGLYIKVDLVEKVPMFQTLSRSCQMELANCLEESFAEPDDLIISNGDEGNEMYFLMHGFADVIIYPPNAGPDGITVATVKRGDFFGELALLKPGTPRTASIQALTYCDIFTLRYPDFARLLSAFDDLREGMMEEARRRGLVEEKKEEVYSPRVRMFAMKWLRTALRKSTSQSKPERIGTNSTDPERGDTNAESGGHSAAGDSRSAQLQSGTSMRSIRSVRSVGSTLPRSPTAVSPRNRNKASPGREEGGARESPRRRGRGSRPAIQWAAREDADPANPDMCDVELTLPTRVRGSVMGRPGRTAHRQSGASDHRVPVDHVAAAGPEVPDVDFLKDISAPELQSDVRSLLRVIRDSVKPKAGARGRAGGGTAPQRAGGEGQRGRPVHHGRGQRAHGAAATEEPTGALGALLGNLLDDGAAQAQSPQTSWVEEPQHAEAPPAAEPVGLESPTTEPSHPANLPQGSQPPSPMLPALLGKSSPVMPQSGDQTGTPEMPEHGREGGRTSIYSQSSEIVRQLEHLTGAVELGYQRLSTQMVSRDAVILRRLHLLEERTRSEVLRQHCITRAGGVAPAAGRHRASAGSVQTDASSVYVGPTRISSVPAHAHAGGARQSLAGPRAPGGLGVAGFGTFSMGTKTRPRMSGFNAPGGTTVMAALHS